MSAGAQRFVYVVVGGGCSKVGVAEMPLVRLSQLQSGSPVPLTLVHHALGDVGLERAMHAILDKKDLRSHGEWFHGEMTEDEARTLVAEAMRQPRPRVPRSQTAQGRGIGRKATSPAVAEESARSLLQWAKTATTSQRAARLGSLLGHPDWFVLSEETKGRIRDALSV